MNLEKSLVSLILGIFIVTSIASIYSLSVVGNPITKEEAIEISKNSELVKEGLAKAYRAGVSEANYHNSSWVEQMKNFTVPWADPNEEWVKRWTKEVREKYAKIPEGHSIWEIIWSIDLERYSYFIIVIVDAEMGIMVHDETGSVMLS